MPRSIAREQDILNRHRSVWGRAPSPVRPSEARQSLSRRIGIHTSIAGGVQNAAERAWRLGCNTFQIFSTSPRQWAPYELSRPQCAEMSRLREQYDLKPLVIHTNYLVNLASTNALFLKKSVEAFRGEVKRALALRAEYLVLHPGSFRGSDREEGLMRTAAAIAATTQGLDLAKGNLTILIENTAGAEYSLGGSFEQVAEVLERLRGIVPIAACIDTCHAHVAGYDMVSESGMRETLARLEATIGLKNVRVWHCNDAKAARGSKLDRHQHIGKGSIGREPFRQLLNDPRLAHAAFIAETPIAEPGDDKRNVAALKRLAR
ncbi:MAG TPA: deoxyribonuclease IV, partial [Bryobacteraceae bacterium]|nr:deoxyribonuclease IV [Bryobacteraceae bacterium]